MCIECISGLAAHDPFWRPQCDALGVPGHTVHAKMCAAMHQLCFGGTALQQLSYTRLKPSAAIIALKTFTAHVVAVFADEFLRSPTPSDMKRLMLQEAKRGVPGKFASVDCTHWTWFGCPSSDHGQKLL